MKKCKECNLEKPLTEYYKSGFGRVRPRCKKCEQLKHNKIFKPKTCAICSKEFMPSSTINKFCSFKCKKEGYIDKRSNKPPIKSCKFCNKEFSPYTSLDKFCSTNCRIENMKSKRSTRWNDESTEKRKGKNNPSYVHGGACHGSKRDSTGLRKYQKVRDELKKEMVDREGFLYCERCKASNVRFETHHIIFRSEKPNHEHLHSKENLIHLCVLCHNHYHKKKGNRNQLVLDRGLEKLFGNDVLNK